MIELTEQDGSKLYVNPHYIVSFKAYEFGTRIEIVNLDWCYEVKEDTRTIVALINTLKTNETL